MMADLQMHLDNMSHERRLYTLRSLPNHLASADQQKDLRRLLLDFQWMESKVGVTDIYTLITDFNLATDDKNLHLVQKTLLLAAGSLVEDISQLSSQLLGRLLDCGNSTTRRLLMQAEQCGRRFWLRPLRQSLTSPDGTLLTTLKGHESYVTALVVCPDGQRVVSGSMDDTLKIWDLRSAKKLNEVKCHISWVTSLALSVDGKAVFCGGYNGQVVVWDSDSLAKQKTLGTHSSEVTAIAVLPDGRQIISASQDGTLKLWNVLSWCEILTLKNRRCPVRAVAFFAEGRYVISGDDDGAVRLWDLEKGRHMHVLGRHKARTRFGSPNTKVTSVTVSVDGKRAITGSDTGELKLWDLETRRELCVLGTDAVGFYAVAFSPDGRYAVSGTSGGDVTLWEIEKGQKLGSHLAAHSKKVCAVSFLPSGRRVISASEDHTLKVWDVNTILNQAPDAVSELGGSTRQIIAVDVFPDGRHAVSISQYGKLRVWQLSDCKCVRAFQSPIMAGTFTTLPDGYRIIVSGIGLHIWDLDQVDIVQRFRAEEFDPGRVIAVSVSTDGRELFSISSTGMFRSWDFETGEQKRSLKFAPSETWKIFSDGHRAISAGIDGYFKVWDIDSGTKVLSFDGHYPLSIKALVLFPEETRSLSAGWDGSLRLWDIERGVELSVIELASPVNALATAPNGRWFASAAEDGKLALWNAERMEVIASFTGDTALTTCTFSPDSCMIIAGDLSGEIHILHLEALDA